MAGKNTAKALGNGLSDELDVNDHDKGNLQAQSISQEPAVEGKVESPKFYGAITGKIVNLDASGRPLVDFPGNSSKWPMNACSIVPISKDTVGRNVLLVFDGNDPKKPIVVGFIQNPNGLRTGNDVDSHPGSVDLELDGQRIVFTADKEIVLRCGEASITLTRAGKILIRGSYLVSRSTGTNRIKGGSVQIN